MLLVACSAALALGATACASTGLNRPGSEGSGQSVPGGPSSSSAVFDPLALVGSWQLEAPGQAKGSVLRLGDDLTLWSSCGYLMGEWDADSAGLFAGHVSGGSGKCVPATPTDPTPAWLAKVVAFTTDAAGAELLDSSGSVVARLKPGGSPTAGPDIASQLAQPPVLTGDLRARFRSAPPLPAGLTPATPSQLVGRWGSADYPKRSGFVELAPDGSWTGSDGANAARGRWSADSAGELVSVSGAQTLVGCGPPDACVDVSGWFSAAVRAGFDGRVLVLFDADGKVTGRLAHAVAPSAPHVPPGSPAPSGSLAGVASATAQVLSPLPAVRSAG